MSWLACVAKRTLLAACLTMVTPAFAADWHVDVNHPACPTGTGGPLDPFCTIQEAVLAASAGDTIRIAPGTYFENVLIDKDLNLIGTGGDSLSIVDGASSGSVVVVAANVVATLDGLTLTQGSAASGGGLFVSAGADVTLANSTVSGNTAASSGGGVSVVGGALTAMNSRVTGNMVTVYSRTPRGGGVYCRNGSVALTDSAVSTNNSQAAGGGIGLFAGEGESSSVQLVRSDVLDNTSGTQGGGIACEANAGLSPGCAVLSLDGSMVGRNSSNRFDGGGISSESFGGRAHSSVTLTNSTVCENTVNGRGGGIASFVYNTNATLTLTGCTIRDNVAGGSGGGVAAGIRGKYSRLQAINMIECTISGNSAFAGGGIRVASVGPAQISHTTVSGNTATNAGGGIQGETVLRSSTVSGNSAVEGGGIFSFGSELVDSLIEGNSASAGGGLLAGVGDSVSGCVSRGNMAQDGAGVHVRQTLSVVEFTDTEISANTATGAGGGAYLDPSTSISLTRCTVAGNAAAQGGGISDNAATATLDHTILAGNTASGVPTNNDCDGTLTSLGYNVIGSAAGCTISGDPTGNQIDVDPLYLDPTNGDYSLQANSPALDAGNQAVLLCQTDAGGNSRILDGDLDGTMILDLGAHEFSNVALQVTGTVTPGSPLLFEYTGLPGMTTFLWAGVASGASLFGQHGCLFIDLAGGPWVLVGQGALPIAPFSVNLPPTTPVGVTFFLQAHAVLAGAGNLAGAVALKVE